MKLRINTYWENDLYNRATEDFYLRWKRLILCHLLCQVSEMQICKLLRSLRRYLQSAYINQSSQIHRISKIWTTYVHFSNYGKTLIQMMFMIHEPSQYFANVSFCALILRWKCGMGSGPFDGPIRFWNPGHRFQKIKSGNCQSLTLLSQWQHLSRHCMHQVSESANQKTLGYNPGTIQIWAPSGWTQIVSRCVRGVES